MLSEKRPITPQACADLVRQARAAVAITGAGVSTAAGIPDFRGPQGLYATGRYDANRVFDIRAFDEDPCPFYAFTRDFLEVLRTIEPTLTHRFLARAEDEGHLLAVITQNIDPLHERAGSRNIVAVHGGYGTSRCRRCGRTFQYDELVERVEREGVPHCPCGGVLKPDVVFFGEPVRDLDEAGTLVARADLVLVLGSSLTVYPAAALPELSEAPTVVVNRGPTGLGPAENRSFADADLDEFLGQVVAALNWQL